MNPDSPVGYSRLHDFLATATEQQLRARMFKVADEIETMRTRIRELTETNQILQNRLGDIIMTDEIEIAKGGTLKYSLATAPIFERAIMKELIRGLIKQARRAPITVQDCDRLSHRLAIRIFNVLTKFQLEPKA